jgi:hypothetical protein
MIKIIVLLFVCFIVNLFDGSETKVKDHFKKVDQVMWVVKDLDNVIMTWKKLGFTQVFDLGMVDVECKNSGKSIKIKLTKANLGGANITWIQPLEEVSVFSDFQKHYGDGAVALIHRLDTKKAFVNEINRLADIGICVLEELTFFTDHGKFQYILMDTKGDGKYVLGYTFGTDELKIRQDLTAENLHKMQLNQYAFTIRNEKPVSFYWQKIGFPPFTLNIPELHDKVYYSKPADYDLKQGWQKHGAIDYEWCVPLKAPTVYEDHIKNHGEGIHHLAYAVEDIQEVFRDYESKGFSVSMAGTWGKKDKPGSGIFAYIDLESAGGVSMELLWNFKDLR